jgi:hypothetical protein
MAPTYDLKEALLPVVRSLDRHGVRYMIGGSVASSALGVARATLDVDLVADLRDHQVEPFAADLVSGYYVDVDMIHEAIRRRGSFNVVHLATMIKVDVFVLKHTPYDRTAFDRASTIRLDEEEDRLFSLASPEDVILHKLMWFRMGGEVADRQWRDVIGVLRVQAERLDWAYLEKWAMEIGVSDLLERAGGAGPEQRSADGFPSRPPD